MVLNFEKFNENRLNESALQDEYRAYFKEILKKYDVKSPMKLSKEDKSKFFDEVKSGWVKGVGRKHKKKDEDVNEGKQVSVGYRIKNEEEPTDNARTTKVMADSAKDAFDKAVSTGIPAENIFEITSLGSEGTIWSETSGNEPSTRNFC